MKNIFWFAIVTHNDITLFQFEQNFPLLKMEEAPILWDYLNKSKNN